MTVATKVKVRLTERGIVAETDRAVLVELYRIKGAGPQIKKFWIPISQFKRLSPALAVLTFNHWFRQTKVGSHFWLDILETK